MQELGAETSESIFYYFITILLKDYYSLKMGIVYLVYMLNYFMSQKCFQMQVTRNPTTMVYTNMRLLFSSYEKSVRRQLLLLVQMLNNVKANISGTLLPFLNIHGQDMKKEEEDQAAPSETQKLKKAERKKNLSQESHQLPLTSGSHGHLWLESWWEKESEGWERKAGHQLTISSRIPIYDNFGI